MLKRLLKVLVETPAVRAEFNSDGCCSRYRSAASRYTTAFMELSHRNVQDGIFDADGYNMHTIQKHLSLRPWKPNEACEAPTILRSGNAPKRSGGQVAEGDREATRKRPRESHTARSFLRRLGRVFH